MILIIIKTIYPALIYYPMFKIKKTNKVLDSLNINRIRGLYVRIKKDKSSD
jgi:hypothetical protein